MLYDKNVQKSMLLYIGENFFSHIFRCHPARFPLPPSNVRGHQIYEGPGIDQFGVVLEIAVVESLHPRELFAIPPVEIYSVRVRVPEPRLSSTHSRRCGSCSVMFWHELCRSSTNISASLTFRTAAPRNLP